MIFSALSFLNYYQVRPLVHCNDPSHLSLATVSFIFELPPSSPPSYSFHLNRVDCPSAPSLIALMPPGTLPLIAPYKTSQAPRVSLAMLIQLQGDRPLLALRAVRDVFRSHVDACRICTVAQRTCGAGPYCVELSDEGADTRTPTPRTSESGTAYVFTSSLNISGVSSLSGISTPQPLSQSRGPLLSRPATDGCGAATPLDFSSHRITLCHSCCHFVHDACWAEETSCCARCCNLGDGELGSSASEASREDGVLRLMELADLDHF